MASNKPVVDLRSDRQYTDVTANKNPLLNITEEEKTPLWYYSNMRYGLSFYNQPITRLSFDTATSANSVDRGASNISRNEQIYPVDMMLRMMLYYLGKQPNLDYAWMTPNVSSNNLQASWVKGNDVAEYIHHFRGLMIPRLSRAEFTGKPINKEAVTARSQMYDKLVLKQALMPMMSKMEASAGIEYNPMDGSNQMEFPEDAMELLETNFNERGAETATDLSNGIYFTNSWFEKLLQDFMLMTITGVCAMEHCVENGITRQYVKMPYQLILDNYIDDDFGRYDRFRGYVEALSPTDIFSQHPELTAKQREIIEEAATNDKVGAQYNTLKNMQWCTHSSSRGTVSRVTYYFKAPHDKGREKVKNNYGNEVLRKVKPENSTGYSTLQDIYKVVVIMDRFMVYYDLSDNLVEDYDGSPMFPVQIFRPNTFGGESVSEVARISKLQDELDMLDFKIREMVGDAKGKKYVFNGAKFGDAVPKELIDSFASCGIYISVPTGETEDITNAEKMVEVVDMTLDPNIYRIVELYKERKERMNRVMSVTDASLGQQAQYIGLGVQQNAIAQSTTGLAYTIDFFLDWVVKNMMYAMTQQKNLPVKEDSEIAFMVGKEGIKYIKFTKGFRFQQFMIKLTVNDSLNAESKQRMNVLAQAFAQNSLIDPITSLKLETANSATKAIDILEYAKKKQERSQQKQSAMSSQQQADLMDREAAHESALQEQKDAAIKENNDNNNEVKLILADLSGKLTLVTQYLKLQESQALKEEQDKQAEQQQQQQQVAQPTQ